MRVLIGLIFLSTLAGGVLLASPFGKPPPDRQNGPATLETPAGKERPVLLGETQKKGIDVSQKKEAPLKIEEKPNVGGELVAKDPRPTPLEFLSDRRIVLDVDGEQVTLEVADTRFKQTRGLTNRKRPDDAYGMLYVLEEPSRYAYWMKDMLFSTDVIWLDEQYRVIDLEASLSAENSSQIYEPDQPALFVLEFPDGFVKRHAVKKGERIDLSTARETR